MRLKKIRITAQNTDEGKRLDQVLAEHLPSGFQSRTAARRLLIAGAVYLNRKRVRIASKRVLSGATLEIFLDLNAAKPAHAQAPFQITAQQLLFEDDVLIAVNKPPGIPTQPTLDEARMNMVAAVKKYLAGNGHPYLGLHHRLDRDTSGVLLFTKSKTVNAAIARQFAHHEIQKTYQALTVRPERLPPTHWSIQNYLGRLASSSKQSRFGSVRSGGNSAHTDFTRRKIFTNALWIEAHPRTGRTHQIRVHLAESGMLILGDPLYGPASKTPISVPRLLLHAESLTFTHPVTNLKMSIQSPLPEDFTKCLQQLQEETASRF